MVAAINPKGMAWNNSANADPVAGVGGIPIAPLGGGTVWVAAGLAEQGSSIEIVAPPLTLTGYSVLSA